MEFQAYPSIVPTGRKGVRALLRLQNILHSTDSIVLPATMLLLGVSLIAYQHCTGEDTSRGSVWNFLLKIVSGMFPLAILEFKVPKCADPVGLFSRFSIKVMIMHAAFLALRCSATLLDAQLQHPRYDSVMLLAACALLPSVFGFRPTPRGIWEHRDVILLLVVPISLAALEVRAFSPSWYRHHMEDTLMTSADYIECLAFVPAVWMAFRRAGEDVEQDIARVSESQKRALCLFAFMLVFYSKEDICNAVSIWNSYKIASVAHTCHYLLVLDFAGFLLAHLCDPAKLQSMKGSFMNWMADVCSV